MEQTKKIQFDRKSAVDFYQVLSKRVEDYFKINNISKHANAAMVFKTLVISAIFVLSYIGIISNLFGLGMMLVFFAINGFFAAMVGFNISHDAVHGAYSSNKTLNRILGATFNLLGTSDYVWKIKHNIVHHTFTNIPDHDSDIEDLPFIRISASQEKKWNHRFQHIYMFFFYLFTTLSWVFKNDYENFFRKDWGWYKNHNHPKIEYFRLFFYKALYYFMFLVLPFLVVDQPWYFILLGFVILHFVEGMTLAVVFQLAHVVEEAEFPIPNEEGKLNDSWAAHQLKTTSNFARKSHLANFICGGLNFQIEHHLFPAICHIHYTKLAPIVQRTAHEFGLPYNESKTFWAALKSHVRMMQRLGTV